MDFLSLVLDPHVGMLVSIFYAPQNVQGFNLGYAFVKIRSVRIARVLIKTLTGVMFFGVSNKKLTIGRAHIGNDQGFQRARTLKHTLFFDEDDFHDFMSDGWRCANLLREVKLGVLEL